MEQQESIVVQGAKIVGLAAIAAGVAGGVFGRVFESQRKPDAGERLQTALDEVKTGSGKTLFDAFSDAADTARAEYERAKKQSGKRRKQAKSKAKEVDPSALVATGLSFSDYIRQAILDSAERIGGNLQETLDQSADSLGKTAEETRKVAAKERKKQRKVLDKQASEGVQQAMKLRKDARTTAEDRYHDIEKRTREAVDKRVKPALEKAGAVTLAGANEARHWLEEESKELEKRYAEARPKIEKRYAEARPKIENSAEHYSDVASELAKELRKVAQERARDAEHLLQEGTVQARALAQDAGENVKDGGKNAGSLLMWTAIAGGLIYQVLLDDEQKQKVRDLASSAFHEGRAMYEDMRGENANFSA